MNILNRIYPDPLLLDYVLLHLSSCLDGLNSNELVHFWTGMCDHNGSNGKSWMCSLLTKCYGNYCVNAHPSIITNATENSECANISIMALEKKRLVIIQEIEKNRPKIDSDFCRKVQ
jgi:phage/plasmid-associated DNA primase